jgi:hypothetical protein
VRDDGTGSAFEITPWSDSGIASLQASGDDLRSALEAVLQAVVALAAERDGGTINIETTQSVPIRGEGKDLPTLVADLIEDLFVQRESFAVRLRDVAIDGVVHRDQGGFVAWGYADALPEAEASAAPIRLHSPPAVIVDQPSRVVFDVSLARDQKHEHL